VRGPRLSAWPITRLWILKSILNIT
jgi:hypothetical protein